MRVIKHAIASCLLPVAAVCIGGMDFACLDDNNQVNEATGKSVVAITNNSTNLDVVGFYLVAQSGAKEQDWGNNLLPAPVPPGEQQDVGEFDTSQTYDSLLVTAPLDDHSATTEWPYPDVQLAKTEDTLYRLSDAGVVVNSSVPTLSSRWGDSGYYGDPDWPYAWGWDFSVSATQGIPVVPQGVLGPAPLEVKFVMKGEAYPWSPEFVEGILDFGDGSYLRWHPLILKTTPTYFSFEVYGHVYGLDYPPAWDTDAGLAATYRPKFTVKRKAVSYDEFEATWTETNSVLVHVLDPSLWPPVGPLETAIARRLGRSYLVENAALSRR